MEELACRETMLAEVMNRGDYLDELGCHEASLSEMGDGGDHIEELACRLEMSQDGDNLEALACRETHQSDQIGECGEKSVFSYQKITIDGWEEYWKGEVSLGVDSMSIPSHPKV